MQDLDFMKVHEFIEIHESRTFHKVTEVHELILSTTVFMDLH